MLIVDLSSNNAAPDFRVLARHVQGAYIKASEGIGYTNPFYARWKADADLHGLRTGAYHFARLTSSASAEAEHFCNVVGRVGRRDLRPVLDFETWNDHLSPSEHERWARDFNRTCRARLGVTPVFYSYGPFIDKLELNKPIGDGLWEAAYGRNDGAEYPFSTAHPWRRVVCHQFTSQGRVLGCGGLVDLSRAVRVRGVLAHPAAGLL